MTPEYVRYLVEVANDKMEANRKRTERFLAVLQHSNEFGGTMAADNSSHLSLNCDHFEVEDESQLGNENGDTYSGISIEWNMMNPFL